MRLNIKPWLVTLLQGGLLAVTASPATWPAADARRSAPTLTINGPCGKGKENLRVRFPHFKPFANFAIHTPTGIGPTPKRHCPTPPAHTYRNSISLMKIIHTADWHLGNSFHGHDRTDEHRHFLNWLLDTIEEEQPDALLVAGDVFDSSNPSAAAEELLYDFLLRATTLLPGLQVVVTAGNHDSGGRLEAPASLLKMHNVYVRGLVHRTDADQPDFDYYLLPLASRTTGEAECVCMAVPFLRSSDYPAGMTTGEGLAYFFDHLHRACSKSPFAALPRVAVAHFYAADAEVCESEHSERLVVGGQDYVEADVVGRRVAYTALGHIHKCQQVKGADAPMAYAGSALPMSFSETAYTHGVQVVDIDQQGHAHVGRIDYEPLRRLQRIPESGRAVQASEVVEAIARLPKRRGGDDGSSWPYLEIRVEERQPEPTLMHDVAEALKDRAVHFCRMVRVQPEAKHAADGPDKAAQRLTLQELTPLEMARRVYAARYKEDMPQQLVERFKMAEQKHED